MAKKNKLVIDTNLWVSWLISGRKSHLNRILLDEQAIIFSSSEQVIELFEVIERGKFRKYLTRQLIDEFKLFFLESVNIVKVTIKVEACPDPDDDFLIALAVTAGADYLVTGDKVLLGMKKYKLTKVIPVNRY
ncbi:MAG TPA: putative toxin-antitoxin system toxin component, PIN family [Bacteroidia bacterium]|jgi:putative PIN family toxin of toxin-antitoxin system|nr:putative toxin-antitoxin system toxin component, PIN family [Bacteroidia bacterium]